MTSSAGYLGLASGPALGGLIGAELGFAAVFMVVGVLLLATLALVVLGAEKRPGGAAPPANFPS